MNTQDYKDVLYESFSDKNLSLIQPEDMILFIHKVLRNAASQTVSTKKIWKHQEKEKNAANFSLCLII